VARATSGWFVCQERNECRLYQVPQQLMALMGEMAIDRSEEATS